MTTSLHPEEARVRARLRGSQDPPTKALVGSAITFVPLVPVDAEGVDNSGTEDARGTCLMEFHKPPISSPSSSCDPLMGVAPLALGDCLTVSTSLKEEKTITDGDGQSPVFTSDSSFKSMGVSDRDCPVALASLWCHWRLVLHPFQAFSSFSPTRPEQALLSTPPGPGEGKPCCPNPTLMAKPGLGLSPSSKQIKENGKKEPLPESRGCLVSHPVLRPKPDAHRMHAQNQAVIHTARM
jgi:hypothetical protein